jgi:hypothetical protein
MHYRLKSCIKQTFALLLLVLKSEFLERTVKKLLTSKANQTNSAKVGQGLNRKNVFAVALVTFLMIVAVSEGIRLTLMHW